MLIYETDNIQIYHADSLDVLRSLPDNCLDACVTDPPYGLGFMNREWDKALPHVEIWIELLRVLKPGAHGCIMGGTRKFHRLFCHLEDAGFEIRDVMMWVYGSGFPKSHNVALSVDKHLGKQNRGRAIPTASTYQACDTGREHKLTSNPVPGYVSRTPESETWEDWGTALKPAYEPIALVRKPFRCTVAENVLEWGVGGLNIGACRVPRTGNTRGSWPANLLHDGSGEVLALFPDTQGQQGPAGGPSDGYGGGFKSRPGYKYDGPPSNNINTGGGQINHMYKDTGSAARFFYCIKASKNEREAGLSGEARCVLDGRSKSINNPYLRGETKRLNTWPTVKPIALLRYLARLITPLGGVVVDPFAGSGSTALACIEENFQCVAIEREEEACNITLGRLGK